MRIAMVGTGYVGLVSGACLSEFGHEVACIDNNGGKIDDPNWQKKLEGSGFYVEKGEVQITVTHTRYLFGRLKDFVTELTNAALPKL